MLEWKIIWCLYNSSALKLITALIFFGTIAITIPALLQLPPKRPSVEGSKNRDRIKYNKSRNMTIRWGIYSMPFSLFSLYSYYQIFSLTKGATGGANCTIDIQLQNSEMLPLLSWLYIASLVTIFFYSCFYLKWQDTLKQDKELGPD